jgi:hypothetical protein
MRDQTELNVHALKKHALKKHALVMLKQANPKTTPLGQNCNEVYYICEMRRIKS